MTLDDKQVQISEKVRFWEEQDEINKALIPRVIRQHELLAKHIGEHEDLPLIVAQAVGQAAYEAREEQRKLYEAALEAAKSEFDECLKAQQRQYDEFLSAAHTEFSYTLKVQVSRIRNVCLIAVASAVVAMILISVLVAILIG